jgi:hypothetical protein
MTSLNLSEEADNGSATITKPSILEQTTTLLSVDVPSYSQNSRIDDIFNKENLLLEDESTVSYPKFPPRQSLGEMGVNSSLRDGSDQFQVPLTMPPMMRYASSAAFSDITAPFPSIASSQSFYPYPFHGYHHPHPTELYSYASAGQQMYGISPSLFGTPVNTEAASFLPNSTVDTSYIHDNGNNCDRSISNAVTTSDLSLVASALLDLTPAVINKSLDNKAFKSTGSIQCTEINSKGFSHGTLHRTKIEVETSRFRVAMKAKEIMSDVPFTLHACTCKNTYCLKLYCSCFQTKTFCDEAICQCRGCNNTAEHSVPRGTRTRAIYEILNRRLDAFEPRFKKKVGQGCSCKKSK